MQKRRLYGFENAFRKYRINAIATSLLLHGVVIVGLFIYLQRDNVIDDPAMEDLDFGSSGGGGEEHSNKNEPVEFGAHEAMQEDPTAIFRKATVNLIKIELQQELSKVENALPVLEKEKPKPLVARKLKPKKSIIAENLPIGHRRHGGDGPGSDGGMGGGSGGGIGARQGYSIDWGGTGSRRLLSGRLPEYPKGTDKQMAVVLRFSVMPDGSVDQVLPTRRTDELLERAATVALRSWRFDPLPTPVAQRSQTGRVTFNFKLEQSERD